jgi:hypothetical protein
VQKGRDTKQSSGLHIWAGVTRISNQCTLSLRWRCVHIPPLIEASEQGVSRCAAKGIICLNISQGPLDLVGQADPRVSITNRGFACIPHTHPPYMPVYFTCYIVHCTELQVHSIGIQWPRLYGARVQAAHQGIANLHFTTSNTDIPICLLTTLQAEGDGYSCSEGCQPHTSPQGQSSARKVSHEGEKEVSCQGSTLFSPDTQP